MTYFHLCERSVVPTDYDNDSDTATTATVWVERYVCAGCEYGDHDPDCKTLSRMKCYNESTRQQCCETCQRLLNASATGAHRTLSIDLFARFVDTRKIPTLYPSCVRSYIEYLIPTFLLHADLTTKSSFVGRIHCDLLLVRQWHAVFGNRAFPTAAPRIWNSLPLHVTSAPSLQTFKKRPKPFKFSRSFPS